MFTKSKDKSRLLQERGCRLDQKRGRGCLRKWYFSDKGEEELARCDQSSESEGFCTVSPAERAQCICRRGTAGTGRGQEEVGWQAECSEVEDMVTRVPDGADVRGFFWEGETVEGREGRCSSVSM